MVNKNKHSILTNNLFILSVAIVFICIILSVSTKFFASAANVTAILSQMSMNGIQAIGLTICVITVGIDLSVGSVLTISGVTLALSLEMGAPAPLAILISLATGGFCGLTNGLIVSRGNVPAFIATLGMQSIASGAALIITGGRPISGVATQLRFIGSGRIGILPVSFVIMLGCFAIAFYIMNMHRLGRYFYTIGGNKEAAKLSGINVKLYSTIPFIISGVMCAIASIIVTSRLNSAEPIAGANTELDAVAAAVIGGTSLSGGEGKITGTFLGSLMMSIIKNGMVQLGVGTYPQQVIIGVIIILVVFFDMMNRNKK